jgi:HlyD family secretion protein
VATVKRWLPSVMGLAVLAGAIAFVIVWRPWSKAGEGIKFQTVTVGKGVIAAQVTANGTLSARGTVEVGAQVSGRVEQLFADFNAPVTKGQVIAKLDESLLRAQIDQAKAAYDLAVANQKRSAVAVADAKRQLDRQRTLKDQQLVAGATLEQAEVAHDTAIANLAASKAQVNQAAANLKQARTNLTYATIVSPVDGVVLSRSVDVGQTVASSLQAPVLFTIAEDLRKMEVHTSVAEGDVGRLASGMDATFTVDAFPGERFKGKVGQIRNAAQTVQNVVTYDAVIEVDNDDLRLRPGMTATVTIVHAERADVLAVANAGLRFKPPAEALSSSAATLASAPAPAPAGSGGGNGGGRGRRGHPGEDDGASRTLYVLRAGSPEPVSIKTGLSDGTVTEVVSGDLHEGDEVVVDAIVPGKPGSSGGGGSPRIGRML